jgi:hypothetical protein
VTAPTFRSRTTARFRETLAGLPAHVRAQARDAFRRFQADPMHPGLRFKQIHDPPPTYSVRVGLGYRALGVLEGDTVAWFWIGTHAEYDRLLRTL